MRGIWISFLIFLLRFFIMEKMKEMVLGSFSVVLRRRNFLVFEASGLREIG